MAQCSSEDSCNRKNGSRFALGLLSESSGDSKFHSKCLTEQSQIAKKITKTVGRHPQQVCSTFAASRPKIPSDHSPRFVHCMCKIWVRKFMESCGRTISAEDTITAWSRPLGWLVDRDPICTKTTSQAFQHQMHRALEFWSVDGSKHE